MSETSQIKRPAITGAKGGKGGGGGSPRVAKEAPNTLRSKAVAVVQDLVAGHEIVGLVDGLKSVFLDGTPVENADGTRNFEGVELIERTGAPDQDPVTGIPAASSPEGVEIEVRAGAPVVRTFSDPPLDRVIVTMRIAELFEQNKKNGDLNGFRLSYRVEVAADGGPFVQADRLDLVDEKTIAPWEVDHPVDLPKGGAPWRVRVVRESPEDAGSHQRSTLIWARAIKTVDHKFTYPNSAYYTLRVDAEQFGGRIPTRAYEIYAALLLVPSNYDPEARTYAGLWDGTFKRAWSDNGVWFLYTLMVDDLWGLGRWIKGAQVDKWGLYQLAQYCDQLVPDGFGGMQPRYTFNAEIRTHQDALRLLQQVASAFHAMTFWSGGAVSVAGDRPQDPVLLVTPANVLGGEITYAGTGYKSRHSRWMVSWRDPENGYKPSIETLEDPQLIERYGVRTKHIAGVGITRQGQAARHCRWELETQESERETASWSGSLDHMIADGTGVMPGDVVAIADPSYADIRMGGRLAHADARQPVLDAPATLKAGETYTLSVTMPDGSLAEREVVTPTGQTTAALTLAADLPQTPLSGAVYILISGQVAPKTWRVLAAKETRPNVVEMLAAEHDPTKWGRIEQTMELERPSYTSVPTGPLPTPPAPVARMFVREGPDGRVERALAVTVQRVPDPRARVYALQMAEPGDGFKTVQVEPELTYERGALRAGAYRFRARALDGTGAASPWSAVATTEAGGNDLDALRPARVAGLELFGAANAAAWTGKDARFVWRRTSDVRQARNPFEGPQGADTSGADPLFDGYRVRIFDAAGTLLRLERTDNHEYTYSYEANLADGGPHRTFEVQVTKARRNGLESAVPARLTVSNPAPDLPLGLSVTAGINAVYVTYDQPDAPDWAGAKVWVETASGFDPLTAVPRAESAQTAFAIDWPQGTPAYVRLALYDVYGRDPGSLNVTAEYAVSTVEILTALPVFEPDGITFTPVPASDQVQISAGTMHVTQDGVTTSYPTGNATKSYTGSGTLYLYYIRGENQVRGTHVLAAAIGTDRRILASYRGASDLQVRDGNTIVHGDQLLPGTVGAQQIVAGQAVITGPAQIATALINAGHIDFLSADDIVTGTLNADQVTVADGAGNVLLASGGFNHGQINALLTANAPAEAGADATAGKSLSLLSDRTVDNLTDASLLAKARARNLDNLIDNPGADSVALDPHADYPAGGLWQTVGSTNALAGDRIFRYRPAGQSGTAVLVFNGSLNDRTRHPACFPGEVYLFDAYVRTNATPANRVRVNIWFYDATGAFFAGENGVATSPTTSFEKIQVSAPVPAGAAYAIFNVQVLNDGLANDVWVDALFATRKRDVLQEINGPAEAGADATAGKSLSVMIDRNADLIAETIGKRWAAETGANVTENHKALSIETPDTRNANEPPSYYRGLGRGLYPEFKRTSVMGIGSGVNGFLVTQVKWQNANGGRVTQEFYDDADVKWRRRGSSDDSLWESWKKSFDENAKPDLGSDILNTIADNISETGGRRWAAESGADVTAGKSLSLLNDRTVDNLTDASLLAKARARNLDNLIDNPGAEGVALDPHADYPAGGLWQTVGSTNALAGDRIFRYRPAGQSGTAVLVFNGSLNDRTRHPACFPGEVYLFDAHVRSAGGAANRVRANIWFYDATGAFFAGENGTLISPTTSFEKTQVSAPVPAGAAYVTFNVQVINDGLAGDIWVDALFATRKRDVLQEINAPAEAGADITGNHTAAAIAGQGAFATLNQIDVNNISTFIASAAIGFAYIKDVAAESVRAGRIAALGDITVGNTGNSGYVMLDNAGMIGVHDGTRWRFQAGHFGSGAYGLTVYGPNGELMLDSRSAKGINGTFIEDLTVGTLAVQNGAIHDAVSIVDQTNQDIFGGWSPLASIGLDGTGLWRASATAAITNTTSTTVDIEGRLNINGNTTKGYYVVQVPANGRATLTISGSAASAGVGTIKIQARRLSNISAFADVVSLEGEVIKR